MIASRETPSVTNHVVLANGVVVDSRGIRHVHEEDDTAGTLPIHG